MSILTKGLTINDRYMLVSPLGTSTYGEVWLAFDEVTQSNVALKFYISLNDEGIKEFKRSFLSISDLRQQNLLPIRNLDIWDNRPFLIMRHCKKGSAQLLAGRVEEETIWRMFNDMAAALSYLHSLKRPIMHQNLKPANILIDDDDNFMLTDFGINSRARRILFTQSGGNIDREASAFMAPERFSDSPDPIKASDIWALGACVYSMAVGQPPFDNMGGGKQKNGAPIPDLNPSWSRDLNNLLHACMAKEPWDRPSAKELYAYTSKHINNSKSTSDWAPAPRQQASTPTPTPAPATPTSTASSQAGFNNTIYTDETVAVADSTPAQPISRPWETPQPAQPAQPQQTPQEPKPWQSAPQPVRRPWETDDNARNERSFDNNRFRHSHSSHSSSSFSSSRSSSRKSGIEGILDVIEKYKNALIIIAAILAVAIVALLVFRSCGNENTEAEGENIPIEDVSSQTDTAPAGTLVEDVEPETEAAAPNLPAPPKASNPERNAPDRAGAERRVEPAPRPKASESNNQDKEPTAAPKTDNKPNDGNNPPASTPQREKAPEKQPAPEKGSATQPTAKAPQPTGKLGDALARNDFAEVQKMADTGNAAACGEMAAYLYKQGNYDGAAKYATKAKNAGDVKGSKVYKRLERDGYFD